MYPDGFSPSILTPAILNPATRPDHLQLALSPYDICIENGAIPKKITDVWQLIANFDIQSKTVRFIEP